MAFISFKNQTPPATPASGRTEVYVDSVTKTLMSKDDQGLVRDYSTTIEPWLSAGMYDIPTITETSGVITIDNTGTYNLYNYSDGSGVIHNYAINGGTFTPSVNEINYIVANYNSGSPVIQLTTDVSIINSTTIVPIITIFYDGITCSILDWDMVGKALGNKLHQSIVKTQRYRRESGLDLAEQTTRYITISSGVVWMGGNKRTLTAINSSTNDVTLCYHDSGTWVMSNINQYNNTQYDNGTDLVTLDDNSYAVNFIYRSVDNLNKVYVILGTDSYNFLQSQSFKPTDLPSIVVNTAILVGRIIVLKNATTATEISTAFASSFSPPNIIFHNDLDTIQGGITSQYYHLTQTEHSYISGVNAQALQTTASPTFAGLNINGVHVEKFTTIVNNTTLSDTHNIVYCNKTTNLTINLPEASTCSGRIYTIKNINIGIVTITPYTSELIDGQTSYDLLSRYKSVTIQSTGSTWFII